MSAPGKAATQAPLEVRPLTGALGCEIFGVDVNNLNDATFGQIHQAFLDYSVIVFRDQELDQKQLARFGQRFGQLEDEPFIPYKADVPGVFYLKGGGIDDKLSTQNLGWHTDHSYQKNPSLGAILYALDVPKAGGDTLFASNYLAYENLSPTMQRFSESLVAIHDVLRYGIKAGHNSIRTEAGLERLQKMRKRFPQVEHPLVCTHPESGRKMLYLNHAWVTAIKDLSPIESNAMIDMLHAHAIQEKFQCRVRWRNKSLMMWDNRCVQHSPNPDYSGTRLLLRVAIHSDWEPS